MVRVTDTFAVFEEGPNSVARYEVFKSDGDFSDSNWTGNRYVYVGTELKLIAAIRDRKFVGFERSGRQADANSR